MDMSNKNQIDDTSDHDRCSHSRKEVDMSKQKKLKELDRLDRTIIAMLDGNNAIDNIRGNGECEGYIKGNRCRSLSTSLTNTDRCIMKAVIRHCSENAEMQIINASNNNGLSCRPPKSICPLLCTHPNPENVNHNDLFSRCFGWSRSSKDMSIRRKLRNSIYSDSENDEVVQIERKNTEEKEIPVVEKSRKKRIKAKKETSNLNLTIEFDILTNDMRIGYLFRFGCKKELKALPSEKNETAVESVSTDNTSSPDEKENISKSNLSVQSSEKKSSEKILNQDKENKNVQCINIQDDLFSYDIDCICYECGALDNLTLSKGRLICKINCPRENNKTSQKKNKYEPTVVTKKEKSIENVRVIPSKSNASLASETSARSVAMKQSNAPEFKVVQRRPPFDDTDTGAESDERLDDQGILNKYGNIENTLKCSNDKYICCDPNAEFAKKRELFNQCKVKCLKMSKKSSSKRPLKKVSHESDESDEDSVEETIPKKKCKKIKNISCWNHSSRGEDNCNHEDEHKVIKINKKAKTSKRNRKSQ